jgi:cell division protease FtsH
VEVARGLVLQYNGGVNGAWEVLVSVNWRRNGFVYLLIIVAAAALALNLFPVFEKPEEVQITTVAQWATAGDITSISVIDEDSLLVQRKGSKTPVAARKEPGLSLPETLLALGVPEERMRDFELVVQPPSSASRWVSLAVNVLPFLFAGLLVFLLIRQVQGSNNQAISFGRSRARVFTGDRPTVTFQDVAGVEEAKEELHEVVEFLKEPQKFTTLGARVPKGVLLVGAPGTGKTLLAKAVSGEAGVPFFSISGSEFVEMFVGVGASRVRDLFDQAKRNSPCIIFIDELDAVGRQRGAGLGGSHDEREQTLNQILVEMDGFDTDTNVIILAATNRPDILDPALLRPGRFDRRVVLDRPDSKGREAILQVHVRGKPLAPGVDLGVLAKETPGFVGADIENMVNEAAILAARQEKKAIGMSEFQEAIERVIAGPERRSRLISDDEKEIIAYHEAGHALVQAKLPLCDPVHKVSIVSRGVALGYMIALPEQDRNLQSQAKFEDDLASTLAGRAAEELVFGDITTGASNDLEQATKLARRMVTEFGMSEKLGPMVFGQKEELVFLGREIGEQRNYSEAVARQIDREVRRIIEQAFARAKDVLSAYSDVHHRLARRLIEVETLEHQELAAILAGEPVDSGQAPPALTDSRPTEPQAHSDTEPLIEPRKGQAPRPVPAPI